MTQQHDGRTNSTLRQFLANEASGGIVLMAVATLAIVVANSPLAPSYFHALHSYVGPLTVQHWINDALMALFFLLVGLEIKREIVDGQLSTWSRRLLPGIAAAGGMLVPAVIFIAFNFDNSAALRGWAIPSATDIAFALGVLSLLGPRVPASLKVFLAALAIIDDLGAVIIIAIFYSSDLSALDLMASVAIIVALSVMNVRRIYSLAPYLVLGLILWIFVLRSGVHATLAGVILAMTIPIIPTPGMPEVADSKSTLHRLEHLLQRPVAFLVVPIFGFANAGVSFEGVTLGTLAMPLTLGVATGLVVGKLIGVFGVVAILVRSQIADLPAGASWGQMFGVSLLCGIGFTMSLFIGLLAFDNPTLQDRVKIGILVGSIVAGVAGYAVLRMTASHRRIVVGHS